MKQSLKHINSAHSGNFKILSGSRSKSVAEPTQTPMMQSRVKQISRDRLIELNRKLRKQVVELAEHMEEIVAQSQHKKKYGLGLNENQDKETALKKLEVKKQDIHIMQLKHQIETVKKENKYVYDEEMIRQKENEVKSLQMQVEQLQKERAGLQKVRKERQRVVNEVEGDLIYSQKVEKTRNQLHKIKEQCKVLFNKIAENEKVLLKHHERTVGKAKKIKDIEEKIRENKEKIKKGIPSNIVTVDMIAELEEQIIKLESEHKDSEKVWGEKLANLEVEHSNRRAEEEKKLLILKEKEKEVKLNDIKLKEYKKLIIQARHDKKASQENMKEFRNKRNIKYMEREGSR